jgi:hypothetical protein
MALDRDGTQMYAIQGGVPSQVSSGDVTNICDESQSGMYGYSPILWGQSGSGYFFVYFPEKRDVTHYYLASGGPSDNILGGAAGAQVSVDTTNGIDGTWTNIALPTSLRYTTIPPRYRTTIVAATASGIRGMRWNITSPASTGGFAPALQVYGTLTAGENPDRLELWHPTSDERVGAAYFDWGDVGRGSTGDLTFRVKNQSATLTADTITVSVDGLAQPTPTVSGAHTLSNGGAFAATTSVASLAPGAISDVLTLRRILAANAALSVWTFRVNAVAASWS